MFAIREEGLTVTDLDRYLLKRFKTLITGSGESRGLGFIHPSRFQGIYEIRPYPYHYKNEPVLLASFDTPPKELSRPVYAELLIKKQPEVRINQSFKKNEVVIADQALEVKSWEEVAIEDLKSKIFQEKRDPITGDRLPPSGSYSYFKSRIMMDIEGYSGEKLYDDLTESLLDGTEIEGKEDLLPLVAVASSPFSFDARTPRAGGFHAAIVGKAIRGAPVVEKRILGLTTDPVLDKLKYWKGFGTVQDKYTRRYSKRSLSIAREYAVLLRQKRKKKSSSGLTLGLLKLPFDYPLQVVRGPKLEDEEQNDIYSDPDLLNYLTWLRFTEPAIPREIIKESGNISRRLVNYYSKQDLPEQLLGKGTFFDPSYYGKPETVLRLAIALARIHDSHVSFTLLDLAEEMLYTILNSVIHQESEDPATVYTKRGLEKVVYKTLLDLKESYPKGIPLAELEKIWKNKTDVRDALESLVREGAVIYLSRNTILPVE